MVEHVYMVWDLYDGVRSGIADYEGNPHYFESIYSEDSEEHTDEFRLTPVDQKTLKLAQEQWSIYRDWEKRFHSGLEPSETHPGHGGVDARYDQLEARVQSSIEAGPVTKTVSGRFRAKEEQPDLPVGCLRDMEVEWL